MPADNDKARDILYDADNYALAGKEQVLVRTTKISPEQVTGTIRRVVPRTLRRFVLSVMHDSRWSGAHRGREKTYRAIQEKFFWEGMYRYVQLYVKTCQVCQCQKSSRIDNQAELGIIECYEPWELISIDIWGPVRPRAKGNRYLLTVVDAFSKFCRAIPLPNKEAKTIANALRQHVFSAYGVPWRIHSDKGAEFVNSVISELCNAYGVKRSSTTPYHPQGNSYAEQVHQFYWNAVSSFIRAEQNVWDELIVELMIVYNNTYHKAVGTSPSMAFMGRNLPVWNDVKPIKEKVPMTPMQFSAHLEYVLGRAEYLIREQIDKKIVRNKLTSASKNFCVFQAGEKVKIYAPRAIEGDSAKLSPPFHGPYWVVSSKLDGKVYYLKNAECLSPESNLGLTEKK